MFINHSTSPTKQLSIAYGLVDKETNAIESSLTILNVTSVYNSNNFTCKVVQQQPYRFNSTKSNNKNDLVTNAYLNMNSTQMLRIAFKPLISVELINLEMKKTIEIKNSQNNIESVSSSLSSTNLTIFNETNVLFKCNYKANPINDVVVRWFLNGVEQQHQDILLTNQFEWAKRADGQSDHDLLHKQTQLMCQVENSVGTSTFLFHIQIARKFLFI